MIQENCNFDSTSPQLPFHINSFCIYILFSKICSNVFCNHFGFCNPWFPHTILFRKQNPETFKATHLKLNSKCFSANPLSPILVTVCSDAYDLDSSTMHLKFDLTGIPTHDLQIMIACHVTEMPALTTWPSAASYTCTYIKHIYDKTKIFFIDELHVYYKVN